MHQHGAQQRELFVGHAFDGKLLRKRRQVEMDSCSKRSTYNFPLFFSRAARNTSDRG